MIEKHGKVTVTSKTIEIVEFRFDCTDGSMPYVEAMEWASEQLRLEIIEAKKQSEIDGRDGCLSRGRK